jgi:hypothetical protein
MNDSKKPDEREQTLRVYLGRLKDQARSCSNTTDEILQHHVLFASLMAQRIDDASKSPYNLKYDGPETTKLAKDINKASRSLSTNVTQMMYDLNLFVSTLEKLQVAAKTERSLAEHTLRWLKSLLKAVAGTCPPVSPLSPSAPFPISALREAATKFCTVDSGALLAYIQSFPRKDRSN